MAPEPEREFLKRFAGEINITETLATLLINRGITTYDSAKQFFRPSFSDLHDPFLMDGMEVAVTRVLAAIEKKEKIFVYGDYDVDGTNATAMTYLFLKSIGGDATYYVPDRVTEGYGISVTGIQKAKELGVTLMVAVDCGITAADKVEIATEMGIEVIICDHHQPGETIPRALAVLDPIKPGCNYPFKYLCGAGVAFKLIHGILLRRLTDITEVERILRDYLQFVVLATSADIVPIIGENRILLKIGLELLNKHPNTGIKALIKTSGIKPGKISIGQIVFVLAPRINAVGRMGDAHRAIHLLTTTDEIEALELANVLEMENTARRKVDEETFGEAQIMAESFLSSHNPAALVLHNEHWHPGVIGIVASRIVEKYYRPTVMLTTVEGKIKGSARSVDGFDIYSALSKVDTHLLQYGGHKYAAGVLLDEAHIDDFRQAFSKEVDIKMTDELRTPGIKIDCAISLSELTPRFIRILDQFAPYGPQNMRPVMEAKNAIVWGAPRIVGKGHLRFKVKESQSKGSNVFDVIGFGLGDKINQITHNSMIDLVFSLDEYDEYTMAANGGQQIPQLRIRDFKISNEQ